MSFCLETYLTELEELVNIDSASLNPEGTAQIAEYFAKKFSELGWQTSFQKINDAVGPCLKIYSKPGAERYDILMIGHMDTALPKGTPAERPFSRLGNYAYGPGVIDMKASLLSIYYTLRQLKEEGALDDASLCLLFSSDEEISSIYSRPIIEEMAKKSSYCLVLEPARKEGTMVNQRRGVGRYTLHATGVAAHSGVNPQEGSSAINELANWIVELHKLNDWAGGTSLNVGLISGGSGVNSVAAQATGQMDIRFTDESVPEKIEAKMKVMQAKPFTPGGAKVKVTGGVTRPPMNPSPETLALCDEIMEIANRLQVKTSWIATGGGSDASFTARLGVPTLDGIGPVGAYAHSEREYLEIDSVVPRLELAVEIVRHILKKCR